MKKNSTGLAGAVRIQQLTMAKLTRAEKHGKRLDKTSEARAIYDAPPLTTTGLDLNELFRKHVDGAFVPRARSKAMHVLVQYPKELVDGEDGEYMLHHGREFIERVFGEEAIFADRLDRDEKSRHVVDLFVAPRYTKKTKHQEKPAVSMSRHLKALAKDYGYDPTTEGTGRALQDAWLKYLREDMGLDQAQRGSPKLIPGPDRKSAEELRVQELDEREAKADANVVVAEHTRRQAEASKALAAAEEAAAKAMRRDVVAIDQLNHEIFDQREERLRSREAAAERRETARKEAAANERSQLALVQQEINRRQALADDAVRAASSRAEELEKKQSQAEAARRELVSQAHDLKLQLDKTTEAQDAARAERQIVEQKLQAMALQQGQVIQEQATLATERAAMVAERARTAAELDHHQGLLGLLDKAADPDHALDLRVRRNADGREEPVMREGAMTDAEKGHYRQGWPEPIRKLAILLAMALDNIRRIGDQLAGRKREADLREQEIIAREVSAAQERAQDEAERRRLSLVITNLDERRAALDARSAQLETTQTLASTKQAELIAQSLIVEASIVNANSTLMNATRGLAEQEEWASIINHLAEGTWVRGRRGDKAIEMIDSEDPARPLPDWAQHRLSGECPRWAKQFFERYDQLEAAVSNADTLGARLAEQSRRLDTMIIEAGLILTPGQARFAARVQGEIEQTSKIHSVTQQALSAQAQADAAGKTR